MSLAPSEEKPEVKPSPGCKALGFEESLGAFDKAFNPKRLDAIESRASGNSILKGLGFRGPRTLKQKKNCKIQAKLAINQS